MQNKWTRINDNIIYYLEYNILPSLLAFAISYVCFKDIKITNFNHFYNDIKSYINITGEDMKSVLTITRNILKNKYGVKIVSYNPLKIKKVK